MLKIFKAVHKPLYVDGVQVTDDNMTEVARWCSGTIHVDDSRTPAANYIKVDVAHPMTDRQTQAFAGDYVLRVGTSFKVFTPKAYTRSFLEVSEEPCGDNKQTPDGMPCVLGKGHKATAEEWPIIACRSLSDYKVLRGMVEEDQATKPDDSDSDHGKDANNTEA